MGITSVCGGLKTLRKDHRDMNNNSAFVICTIILLVLVSQFAILINASIHMQNCEEKIEQRLVLGLEKTDSFSMGKLQKGILCSGIEGHADWEEVTRRPLFTTKEKQT